MDYKETYTKWLSNSYIDEETKKELESIKNNESEIKERFGAELEFGTAGLRGIIGAGTNRMNKYIVRKATQGLANYILKQNRDSVQSVAIAYDSRNMSPEFSDEAALCLAANGIKAYVFESLRPTPELSFAVRYLKCISGINVTASHNPPEYNGYKAYWEDGAQITPPHDSGIMYEVTKITEFSNSTIKMISKEEAIEKGLYVTIGNEVDRAYLEYLKNYIINKDCIQNYAKNLSIVYTPLNGAGNMIARTLLDEIGFKNVQVVIEQEAPDGNFPTLKYPNPESEEAFTLALELAKKVNADLILATDPDADRVGVCVKDSNSEYHFLTGNMTGSLIAEYILSQKQKHGTLPKDGVLIKNIVTTNLLDAIVENYNMTLKKVLVGFKWFGKHILELETNNSGTFLFGFEEAYGYLAGNNVRDKDAMITCMLLSEILAYCKSLNITIWDYMISIYEKYGYYVENTTSVGFSGVDGKEKMKNIMDYFRNNPMNEIGGYKVLALRDYQKETITNLETGDTEPTGLPSSNVLYYELENNGWLCARPSGTEPKIKFYYGLKGTSKQDSEDKSEKLSKAITEMIDSIT